jgi:hypothetical protein
MLLFALAVLSTLPARALLLLATLTPKGQCWHCW